MACNILLEDGGRILLEDGSGFLLLENCIVGGGGIIKSQPTYAQNRDKWLREQAKLEEDRNLYQAQLEAVNAQIAQLEAQRLADLSDIKMQSELRALFDKLQEIQIKIRYLKIMEDDNIIILSCVNKFFL